MNNNEAAKSLPRVAISTLVPGDKFVIELTKAQSRMGTWPVSVHDVESVRTWGNMTRVTTDKGEFARVNLSTVLKVN